MCHTTQGSTLWEQVNQIFFHTLMREYNLIDLYIIPLFSPPSSFHNFSILVLAENHHRLPISKATQTSAADLAGSSFQLVKQ